MTDSVLGKKWSIKQINEYEVTKMQQTQELSDLTARLLSARGITADIATEFLNPKIKYLLPDPLHLLDMDKAVNRTITAIKEQHKICIFADYDVDGATSSALLKNIFRDLDNEVDVYVPDRIAEGYGPTPEAMQKIRNNGAKLVITVDCGAMAHEALLYAKEVGLEVIVLDHHLSDQLLPEAVAVVNPNRIDETTSLKYLAAVGVSFMFAVCLVSNLKEQGYFTDRNTPNLMKYLDLVALGTVCDVMMLSGLNRAFVAQGLKIMSARQNIGLRTLADMAGLNDKPNCYHLGFVLGPRINAGGRVGKAILGSNLLSTNCEIEAAQIAQELEQYNLERKAIENIVLEEANLIAEEQKDNDLLFIAGHGWHPGVIGIVASRLKEKYNKPTAVIGINGGIGKASCRSVKGIDLGAKIVEAKNKNLLISGGGHAMAAGFTVAENKLVELQMFFEALLAKDSHKLADHKLDFYDAELSASSLNLELMQEIAKLEPYGNGNPEPIFKFEKLYVLKADLVGAAHINCLLAPTKDNFSSKPIRSFAFNAYNSKIGEVLLNPKPQDLTIIGSLKLNRWQMQDQIQLIIKDVIV